MHPSLTILYYRLLGARIGSNVTLDDHALLYECDLITLEDGCRLDSTCLRGFRVERDGYFTLAPITIGRKAVINASTFISPGTQIPPGEVYGPHASSHDPPSQKKFAAYNQTLAPKPAFWRKLFIAYPIIAVVMILSCTFRFPIPGGSLTHQVVNRCSLGLGNICYDLNCPFGQSRNDQYRGHHILVL